MYKLDLFYETLFLTQILVDSHNVQDTQVPVDNVHTEDDSPHRHRRRLDAKTEANHEENNGGCITGIPHVPRPHRELVTENNREFGNHTTHNIWTYQTMTYVTYVLIPRET